jgi:hypothetical protein
MACFICACRPSVLVRPMALEVAVTSSPAARAQAQPTQHPPPPPGSMAVQAVQEQGCREQYSYTPTTKYCHPSQSRSSHAPALQAILLQQRKLCLKHSVVKPRMQVVMITPHLTQVPSHTSVVLLQVPQPSLPPAQAVHLYPLAPQGSHFHRLLTLSHTPCSRAPRDNSSSNRPWQTRLQVLQASKVIAVGRLSRWEMMVVKV